MNSEPLPSVPLRGPEEPEVATAGTQPQPPAGELDSPVGSEPASAQPQPTSTADEVLSQLRQVAGKLDQLQKSFDGKIRYDAGREAVITRLHEELQKARDNLVLSILKPLALNFIQMFHELGESIAVHRAADAPESAGKFVEELEQIRQDVEDALYRHGFETFTHDGPQFEGRRQRARKSIATADPAQNGTVAQRLRKGFLHGDQVVEPETVSVYVVELPTKN